MKKKKSNRKMKKQNIILLVLGILLVGGSILYLVFAQLSKEPKKTSNQPHKEEPEVEYEIKHEVKKVTVQSQSDDYNTNLVDITVKTDDDNVEYVYVSNTGYGMDEVRYFYGELIFDWKVSETQDGSEHTIYVTIVDKEGNIGRESVSYKVDKK